MIRLKQLVVVEGKYDKITLENIIDATIVQTNGFSIFKDRKKAALIRRLALKNGVIIITDSDSAGMQIRMHIKKLCLDCDITNVYIPLLKGKEKRKAAPSAEGFLGVEGMSTDIIIEALRRSGLENDFVNKSPRKITKNDLFLLELSGNENASDSRKSLSRFLSIPDNLSSNAFLDAINALYEYDEFVKEVELWRQEAVKN